LNLGANGINLNKPVDLEGMTQFIQEDIQWALNPPSNFWLYVNQLDSSGARTKVTVQFVNDYTSFPTYPGDVRLAQRDALRMQIMDPASRYRVTVTGQYVDDTSFAIQDPPATPAGALSIVPSIFTLCLALLATLVGRV